MCLPFSSSHTKLWNIQKIYSTLFLHLSPNILALPFHSYILVVDTALYHIQTPLRPRNLRTNRGGKMSISKTGGYNLHPVQSGLGKTAAQTFSKIMGIVGQTAASWQIETSHYNGHQSQVMALDFFKGSHRILASRNPQLALVANLPSVRVLV